eukprot:m.136022 g.136022  ORF g.136022 m.136022 type:complete len:119 (-) comp13987_c0_seq10:654-1010(-)
MVAATARDWNSRLSMLTPSATDTSRKLFCCNEGQRILRGGRYAGTPLRPSSTAPLIKMKLSCGEDINVFIEGLFETRDPFVTSTKVLPCVNGYCLRCDSTHSYVRLLAATLPATGLAC